MNRKIWLLCGIGLLCIFLIDEVKARRRSNKQEKPTLKEQTTDLDIQLSEEEEVGPSTLLEGAVADKRFDVEAKRKEVIKLVEDGINYLKENPLYQAMHMFTHDRQFIRGELYLFVYDLKGTLLASGLEKDALWKNRFDFKDEYGMPVFQEMLAIIKKGSGWLNYQWRNAPKETYVKSISKDGEDFIIGAGYYPHSMEVTVINLVRGAVSLFDKVKDEGQPLSNAFAAFSYKLGLFIQGELYLYAISFDGITMAHGERTDLIGTDAFIYQDATGRFINKEIIERLEKTTGGIWIDYISKRAPKKTYVQKVTDNEGNNYFIACGYYPDTNQKQVVDLVRKGYTFMKKHGLSAAVDEFSDEKIDEYKYGDLYLVTYDYKGVCKAHGRFREYIGRNRSGERDQDGIYWVQEIIKKAKAGGGWISVKRKNAFEVIYVDPIDLGIDKFIITSGFYPISKMEMMILLGKSAASYLKTVPATEAFRQFIKPSGRFIRGDLFVFAFDSTGICLAFGERYDLIWKNLINAKDDTGKPYTKIIINTAMRGAGKVSYKLNGVPVIAYVEKAEKEGRTFIIGSSFWV